MGISGLLPLLKSIHKQCHLRQFAGQTIGVDAYGWLHRGTIACAIDLVLDKPTMKHIDFCMHRVRMLIHFGIRPYLVFDGDHLPGKEGTNKERAAKRKESKRLGTELLKLGKTSQAHLELQKAVDVTPEMARVLIEQLKQLDVEYVVAPYEADSQMVYLERKGVIQGILSEDSDLLVFGAKCLITKLDNFGECVVINRNDFTACKEISLVGWSDSQFRQMAILSGCDYLASISKMGLITAYRLLRKHKTVDRLLRAIQFDGKFKVPTGYADAYNQAEMTFLYQWVFCPAKQRLVNFTDVDASLNLDDLLYIGRYVEPKIAAAVARGDLHPSTKRPIIVPQQLRSTSRPLIPLSRKSTVTETPDLKKSKSIESFFKPRRIPLAELDPNLFTPSPSQQQALQQNRGSFSASPIPAQPPLQRSVTVSASVPSQGARRTVSESFARRSSISHPAKRQRLCSDNMIFGDVKGSFRVESGSSRFFTSTTTEPSPSVRDSKSKRKASNTEFGLWSDDSIEEAMAAIPDVSQSTAPKRSMFSVFKEAQSSQQIRSGEGSQKTELSQSTRSISTSTMQDSQSTGGAMTPATSCDSEIPLSESQVSPSAEESSEEFKELHKKFAYQPDPLAEPSSIQARGGGKKRKSSSQTVSEAVPTRASASASRAPKTISDSASSEHFYSSKKVVETSTSKIVVSKSAAGADAGSFDRPTGSTPPISLPVDRPSSSSLPAIIPKLHTIGAANDSDMFSDAAWAAHDAEIVIPRSSQAGDSTEAVAELSAEVDAIFNQARKPVGKYAAKGDCGGLPRGSEDVLLVPDSASEGEGEVSEREVDRARAMKKGLDLQRFRFGAAR